MKCSAYIDGSCPGWEHNDHTQVHGQPVIEIIACTSCNKYESDFRAALAHALVKCCNSAQCSFEEELDACLETR